MNILERADEVFRSEVEAIEATRGRLGEDFSRAVNRLAACTGRVVITGIGKSGIIGRKIAATMSSTGTPAFFLHPAEAVHGDLGAITAGDVVLAISNSGESEELLRVLPIIREIGAPIIALSGRDDSSLATAGEIKLTISVPREADCFNLAPTASTAALLVFGDALALCVQEIKGFRKSDYALRHPAGEIGRRLALLVDDVMLPAGFMPTVTAGAPLEEAVRVMCRGDLGTVVVIDRDGGLAGILTDGDLRRFLLSRTNISGAASSEAMTVSPKTITLGSSAAAAVREMERHEITSLVVVDGEARPAGIVHLHGVLGGKKLFGTGAHRPGSGPGG